MNNLALLRTKINQLCEKKRLIFAVGDIHGYHSAALTVSQILGGIQSGVVFLGDYIDRGPSSIQTVQLLTQIQQRHPEWIFLMGNHEQMLLAMLDSGNRGNIISTVRPAILEYSDIGGVPFAHEEFLKGLWHYYESESFLFVHGGISRDVDKHVSEHAVDELLWSYDIHPDYHGKKIVRGHLVVPEPQEQSNHINLDTGCFIYGWLTIGMLNEDSAKLEGWIQVSADGCQIRTSLLDSENNVTNAA